MAKRVSKGKGESIIPQAKLLRLFQIIAVLKANHWTIKQLAERFDTSERTIYRYIKLLEEVDFLVEKDFNNRYFIITSDDEPDKIQFTIEETRLMKKLIEISGSDIPFKASILKKLAMNSELDAMPRLFLKSRLAKIANQISEAIDGNRQIILKSYHSANSNEIKDRLVEPVHFGDNYQSINAFDVQAKLNKQFKLDRIGEVIVLDKAMKHKERHERKTTDVFGFTGDQYQYITLRLEMRAYLLLREEYPLSVNYLSKEENHYLFHGPVASFEGAARFVLGLIDKVVIVDPPAFIEFVKSKLELATFGGKKK